MCKLLALSRQMPAYVGSASRFADACELICRQIGQYPDAASAQSSFDELKMLLQANIGAQQHHRPAKKAKDCHPGETERMEIES